MIQNEHVGALSTVNNQSVFCIEGNGSRPSHQGKGWDNSGKSYTLNTIDRHAVFNVAYKCDGSRGGDIAFAITGDHDNRVTDMTNITIEKQ